MRTRTRTTRTVPAEVERLRQDLLAQAPLFEHDKAYAAGVEDAIAAMLELEETVIHLADIEPAAPPTVDAPERDDTAGLPPADGWFG